MKLSKLLNLQHFNFLLSNSVNEGVKTSAVSKKMVNYWWCCISIVCNKKIPVLSSLELSSSISNSVSYRLSRRVCTIFNPIYVFPVPGGPVIWKKSDSKLKHGYCVATNEGVNPQKWKPLKLSVILKKIGFHFCSVTMAVIEEASHRFYCHCYWTGKR